MSNDATVRSIRDGHLRVPRCPIYRPSGIATCDKVSTSLYSSSTIDSIRYSHFSYPDRRGDKSSSPLQASPEGCNVRPVFCYGKGLSVDRSMGARQEARPGLRHVCWSPNVDDRRLHAAVTLAGMEDLI
jgi:hypothetical protein